MTPDAQHRTAGEDTNPRYTRRRVQSPGGIIVAATRTSLPAPRLRPDRLLASLLFVATAALGCTSVNPTPAAATPTLAAAPAASPSSAASVAGSPAASLLPWAAAAAARWGLDSPQGRALAQPDVPYLTAGAANGRPNGITFTPAIARRWWDAWFAHPVDLGKVRQALLPGNLVLSPDELAKAQKLMGIGNTLPVAPEDYNPLALPLVP